MNTEQFFTGQVILINKPRTWTSFDAVRKVKGLIQKTIRGGFKIKVSSSEFPVSAASENHQPETVNAKLNQETEMIRLHNSKFIEQTPESKKIKLKIGHAGTLDPLATGLLIICTGKFTKKIDEIVGAEKEYNGTFTLGTTTESFDLERAVDGTFSTQHITPETIREAAARFTGEQFQVPPAHSAVKVDGKMAYKLARRGKEVKIVAKLITISEFEITGIEMPHVYFRIVCGKGTYIRSLARDFGLALGSGAHVSALCRTRIGNFKLEDALTPEAFEMKLVASQTPPF